jgi:NADPH-dependent glutamate synthase beta subunit-like oxidoreductase
LRTGIPEYRLPLSVLERELEIIRNLRPEILTSKALGRDFSIEDLKEFRAIFIGIGASVDLRMDIPGVRSRSVYSGLELLRWIRTNQNFSNLGKRVAIVGGGNVAIDVARSILRLGAKPILLYRRTKELMPCNPEEIKEMEEEGIETIYLTQPIEIVSEDGVVRALRCCKTILGEEDNSRRQRPLPIKGSEFEISADSIIFAVGEVPNLSILPKSIQVEQGMIIVDSQQATTQAKIYAGGDVVSYPRTVAHAIGAGKRAAFAIDLAIREPESHLNADLYSNDMNNPPSLKGYLDFHQSGTSAQHTNRVVEYAEINTFYFKRHERIKTESLENSSRALSFREVNLGANPEQLREEASRCFQCGVCTQCDNCFLFCPDAAIKWNGGRQTYEVDLEYCKGCGICSFECPHGHIGIEEDSNL